MWVWWKANAFLQVVVPDCALAACEYKYRGTCIIEMGWKKLNLKQWHVTVIYYWCMLVRTENLSMDGDLVFCFVFLTICFTLFCLGLSTYSFSIQNLRFTNPFILHNVYWELNGILSGTKYIVHVLADFEIHCKPGTVQFIWRSLCLVDM